MIDNVEITVIAGSGGNGCISFRREKFVPRGGPDGGHGGDGGSVWLEADQSLNTLLHLSYSQVWRGERGAHASSKNKRGANGAPLVIKVPVGTVVWKKTDETRDLIGDLAGVSRMLLVGGGMGGRGNLSFASALNREPLIAEVGQSGEQVRLELELKLVADVGIVGVPNAGKSTLLSSCSAAKPKIAAYPFTTLDPVLGVCDVHGSTFVVMEVPGLVEGAHEGVGLGHRFLQHAERVRLVWHLLDGLASDPIGQFELLNRELRLFSESLGAKGQMVVMNKIDVPAAREIAEKVRVELAGKGYQLHLISAATGEGVGALLSATHGALATLPREQLYEEGEEKQRAYSAVVRSEGRQSVVRVDDGFRVYSDRMSRIAQMVNLRDLRAVDQLFNEMVRVGLDKKLEALGVQPGDRVRVGRADLEWR